ncbi:HAMP domain-containing sensor histidine kinase [Actinomycetospora sp. TBRC 11914]|uniref:sensor histidine kinase n=1 Tax=Actinomycetospora sp. TBRC 11914 TaxID=2729387 RepID=UPI00289C5572|nr:HAMP domain-containing sensor histidine kinase [Actinomycetospora sp. TBRC 11914]
MAVVVLAGLARLGAGLLLSAVITAGDGELRERATTAGVAVTAGVPLPPGVRVTDVAGTPTDGRGPLPLDPVEIRTLAAGEPVTAGGAPRESAVPLTRWVAVPVTLPDGSRRLVLASRDLLGAVVLLGGAARWFLPGVLVAAAALTLAAWAASRAALRPVDRLRAAARHLGTGQRLPVPPAADELAALAVEINGLLARRDDAVERLRRFSDDAAHELRSPIASVRAQAEVAVAHPSPGSSGEEREAWRSVARDAERLSGVVGDLLALARAEGGTRGDPTPVDLAEALGEALARTPDDGGVAVTVWVPVAVRAAATAAEVGLVLDNLLANARRHARSVVHVSAVPAGRWVRVLVDDDGPGIPPADRERVFDRFTRLDATGGATRAGLGLALVARLVEGRGGTVRAAESPDGGARLAVRWPAAD